MRTEFRHSYGIIPMYKNEQGMYEVLLILQSRLGPKVWGFPKGTPEKGEFPLETAIRETYEEIGCSSIAVQEESSGATESYTFTESDGSVIQKDVTYFVGFLKDKNVTIQKSEVDEYEWVSIEEASLRITYPETRIVFEKLLESME